MREQRLVVGCGLVPSLRGEDFPLSTGIMVQHNGAKERENRTVGEEPSAFLPVALVL